jgi:hypothetical protein
MIATFYSHWFQYNFAPTHGSWYSGAIWPNVFVILVVGPLGYLWLRAKHDALLEAHKAHNEKLELILRHLDPEAEMDGLLDLIADRVDETTPHGIGAVLAALKPVRSKPKLTGGKT